MQNNTLKIISGIIISVFLISFSSQAQQLTEDLQVADSLFEAGKYTESFGIYEAILETGEQVSPAMLLKMAYINEGLGDTPEALYYLNLYYLKTSNDQALSKMELLARDSKLKGFDKSDVDVFANFFYKNFNMLIVVLAAITLIVFGLYMYRMKLSYEKPYFAAITLVILLAALFYTTNFGKLNNQAIIVEPGAYIMSAPSAGSDVLDTPVKGHKVKTLSIEDVWTQIEWDNGVGYIKSSFLKKLYF